MLIRLVAFAFTAYCVLAIVTVLFQRQLLYFPETQIPEQALLESAKLAMWPSDGDYRGLLSVSSETNVKATLVLFHGNAGAAVNRQHYADALEPLGYRVVLAEYPGYGGRGGELSESNLVADARETIRRAYSEFGDPVIVWGESLGTGVASAAVADPQLPVAGLVLVTPFDSLAELAQKKYWYVPARRLIWDRFDSVANLQSYRGPVAVLLAEDDQVIPVNHGKKLYDSITTRKKLWIFDGAGHVTWPADPNASWWREVMSFILQSEANDAKS